MSTDPAALKLEDVDGTLRVTGDLDAFSVPSLATELEQRSTTDGATVAVDLSPVTFIDSSALQVLVEFDRRLRDADGSLVVVRPSDAVRRLFEVAGLDDHFTVVD